MAPYESHRLNLPPPACITVVGSFLIPARGVMMMRIIKAVLQVKLLGEYVFVTHGTDDSVRRFLAANGGTTLGQITCSTTKLGVSAH